MAIKTILVHVHHRDAGSQERLSVAVRLAARQQAHLRGLFITSEVAGSIEGRAASSAFVAERSTALQAQYDESEAIFRKICGDSGISHDWLVEAGDDPNVLARHTHISDLAIVTRPEPEHIEDYVSYQLVEKMIMFVGCPVLVLPSKLVKPDFGERIVVAWKDSLESVRAVRNAIPLLQDAQSVALVHLGEAVIDSDEVLTYLNRHGIQATLADIPRQKRKISDDLLRFTEEHKADMIVMGMYGHSKLRELFFGGLSLEMLRYSDVPLFTCH